MSIEQRNGRLYQYTASRVRGRVVKVYLGPVPPWWAADVRDQAKQEKAKRKADRAQAFAAAERVLAAGVELDQLADKVSVPRCTFWDTASTTVVTGDTNRGQHRWQLWKVFPAQTRRRNWPHL